MISARTKAALAAAKAGGVRLGSPYLTPGDTKGARRARTKIADDFAADVMPYITRAREARASPPPAAAATGPAPVCNGSSIEPGKSYVALRCTRPRLEAALADGPLSAQCPHGHGLVFAPGWWCEACERCVFPDQLRNPDDESGGDDIIMTTSTPAPICRIARYRG
jgi:hypothetical protein